MSAANGGAPLRIGILDGDDIGLEIVPAAVRVAQAAAARHGLEIDWQALPIGRRALDSHGHTLPPATLAALQALDGWILGPIGHRAYPKVPNAINPHPILRKQFDLYANVRPTRSYPDIGCLHDGVDLVIVRENNEGFQPDRNMVAGSGEFRPTDEVTLSVRVITRTGSRRVARAAFELARQRRRLLAGMLLFALLLTAGQLLPTIELSRLSVRSNGLDYRDAVSFSLKPAQVFRAFLPPLVWEAPFSEFVAYIGLSGLALASFGAASAIRSLRRRALLQQPQPPAPDTRSFALPTLGLTFLGVFLAFGAYNPVYYLLYKLVPGISLFRAPARWLLLYAFGIAILAEVGFDAIAKAHWTRRRAGRFAAPLAGLLLLVELFVCGRKLAYNLPTAPAAYDSMRSATAHLLAGDDDNPVRFLSLSDILYDPGDLPDLQTMFASDLSQDAIYDLIVAAKMKEVLAYNLPLRYRLFSVDGYDGGLLPTSRYAILERLFPQR